MEIGGMKMTVSGVTVSQFGCLRDEVWEALLTYPHHALTSPELSKYIKKTKREKTNPKALTVWLNRLAQQGFLSKTYGYPYRYPILFTFTHRLLAHRGN